MPTFFIPIDHLSIESEVVLGPVLLRRTDDVLREIGSEGVVGLQAFEQRVAERNAGTCAVLQAEDDNRAIGCVATAVALLRVFQYEQHYFGHQATFALGGDAPSRSVVYLMRGGAGAWGAGFNRQGSALGWTFRAEQWDRLGCFAEAATAIGQPSPSEGQSRALRALTLLGEALVEFRSLPRFLSMVLALETLLLPRENSGKALRFARGVSFFGCGRQADNLCGRSRDTCPYLDLDPREKKDRALLHELRDKAEPPWLCAEWHRAKSWYELRNDLTHGHAVELDARTVEQSLFWVLTNLIRPMIEWVLGHACDPAGDLDRAIQSLPDASKWDGTSTR